MKILKGELVCYLEMDQLSKRERVRLELQPALQPAMPLTLAGERKESLSLHKGKRSFTDTGERSQETPATKLWLNSRTVSPNPSLLHMHVTPMDTQTHIWAQAGLV